MRGRLLTLIVVAGALAANLQSAAPVAAAPSGSVVSVRSNQIVVKALPGIANGIVVYEAGAELGIVDSAGVTAPGCRAAGTATLCPKRAKLLVTAGDGDDTVLVLANVPTKITGGAGNDSLTGGPAADQIIGQAGNDTLRGGAGNDSLKGSAGDDVFDGGPGADKLVGGAGHDVTEYRDPIAWPIVTTTGGADDGPPGENDDVRTEEWRVPTFNYRADDAALPKDGALTVADETFVGGGNFDLETNRELGIQAVGYYDANGMMRVAARRIGETTWVHTPPLATQYPKDWDDHRYIEVAFDPDGRLHMAGNHHGWEIDPTEEIVVCCMPLHYFRTPGPLDDPAKIVTLTRAAMLSPDPVNPVDPERIVTYPTFFSDGDRFFFAYRDGWSKYAELYVNQFNRTTGKWFNPNGGEPWFSGWQGFPQGDPDDGTNRPHSTGQYASLHWHDGQFHIFSVDSWAHSEDCPAGGNAVDGKCFRTYIRTPDFDHFYDAAGVELATPIEPQTRTDATVIDRARLGGAWGYNTAFGPDGEPMILYGRYVEGRLIEPGNREGNYQVFFARWDGSEWRRVQLTDWDVWNDNIIGHPAIFSIRGPIADAAGTPRWYVKATVWDDPPNTRTTGWHEVDLATMTTTPMPATFAPPHPAPCASGNNNMRLAPLQHPEWTHPTEGFGLISHTLRSNGRVGGIDDEAGDYYYLSYNTIGGMPYTPQTLDHPPVALSVRRTTCAR